MSNEELLAVVAFELDLVLVNEAGFRQKGADDVEVREREVVDVENGRLLRERHVTLEELEHLREERRVRARGCREDRAGRCPSKRHPRSARKRERARQLEGHDSRASFPA